MKKSFGVVLMVMALALAVTGCGDDKKAETSKPVAPAPVKQVETKAAPEGSTTKDVVSREVKPDGTIVETTKMGTVITTDPKTGKKHYKSGNTVQIPTSSNEKIHQFPEGNK